MRCPAIRSVRGKLFDRFIWCATACAALVAVGLAAEALAQSERFREAEVKAAYLYKFAYFVDWPEGSFANARTPITIGVLGQDPFGATLDKLVEGVIVQGRSFQVRRFPQLGALGPCHILFVAASERERWGAIQENLKSAPVLTVADFSGFAQRGGIINFVIEGQAVRFQINQRAAERVGLKIRALLLKLGRPI
jgi:hypothetical protein